jgi:hypothetical protein
MVRSLEIYGKKMRGLFQTKVGSEETKLVWDLCVFCPMKSIVENADD